MVWLDGLNGFPEDRRVGGPSGWDSKGERLEDQGLVEGKDVTEGKKDFAKAQHCILQCSWVDYRKCDQDAFWTIQTGSYSKEAS